MVKKILNKKKTTKRKGGDIAKLRQLLEDINEEIRVIEGEEDSDETRYKLIELRENKRGIENELEKEELYNAQEKNSKIDYLLDKLDEINNEISGEKDNMIILRLTEEKKDIIEDLRSLGYELSNDTQPPSYTPPQEYQHPQPVYTPPSNTPPPQQIYKFIKPSSTKTNHENLLYSIYEFKKISDLISDTNFRISFELYKDIFTNFKRGSIYKDISINDVYKLIRNDTILLNNNSINSVRSILSKLDIYFMELLKIMDYIINTLKYNSYDKLSRDNIPNALITYLGCRIHDFKNILYENIFFDESNHNKKATGFMNLLIETDNRVSFSEDRITRRDSNCGRIHVDYGGNKKKGGVRKLKSYA